MEGTELFSTLLSTFVKSPPPHEEGELIMLLARIKEVDGGKGKSTANLRDLASSLEVCLSLIPLSASS